ncbi:cyclic nucleotide-binding domain-containing protein [Enterococcus raffinosus]|uniref:Crp/Fnr family transcriptional regulator n=1 Tax=Enterococcus raffinosus TaxID=71452 RepID=UPI001C11113A|nr:cyclic nucleotide-binding domain-containing protein [Enterococcus raffinosus]MBU5360730.1 cyclic nucleotide-binding domain-containing protein [Enterococcus raffinosus]
METGLEKHHLDLLDRYGLLDHQSVCRVQQFDSGETIFAQGVEYKYIMIVVSGKAKVCTSAPSGKDLVLAYYLSSGLIGDVELMSDTTYATASVITLSAFECIIVPFQDNQDSMFKNLTFMTTLAKGLSENLISSSYNYTSNALYSGEQRLCTYILQGAYKNYFFDNLTDVAATIGISYRHLLRLLNKLCDDAILKREKRRFQILDKEQLVQRSSEAEYFTKNH